MKSKTQKPNVEIAVAAYNAEKNIANLIKSLISQKQLNYSLQRITINSDVSSDKTVECAKKFKSKYLKVIDSKKRNGFAGTLINLIKTTNADILIILNDDIIIKDKLFVNKIAIEFIKNTNIGLLCCNPVPISPTNFISNAVNSGYVPYKKMFEYEKNGDNVFSVDGKALCFSRELITKLKFPEDLTLMGNVDKYMYFSCISSNLKYKYLKSAKMYFKFPTSIKDFVSWQTRNYKSNKYLVKNTWGDLMKREYKISKLKFNMFKIQEFIKNPIGSLSILVLGIYCSYKAKQENDKFNITWDLVTSTKDI